MEFLGEEKFKILPLLHFLQIFLNALLKITVSPQLVCRISDYPIFFSKLHCLNNYKSTLSDLIHTAVKILFSDALD